MLGKQGGTMRQIVILFGWIKQYIVLFSINVILLVALSYSRMIVPQFISYGIDGVVLGQESRFPKIFANFVQKGDGIREQIFYLSVLLIAYQMLRALLMYSRNALVSFYNENIMFNLREKVYSHLQKLPFTYYKKNDAGDVIQRCTTDVDVIRTFISQEIPQLLWVLAIIFSTVWTMIQVNVTFALISLISVPLIFVSSYIYSNKTRKIFERIDHCEGEMIDVIKENITGIQVVKAFGAQKYELDKYQNKADKYYFNLKSLFSLLAKLQSTITFFTIGQTFVVIVAGIYFIENGTITLGTLILFVAYVKLLSNPIRMLGRLLSRMGRNFVAIDRVHAILESELETVEDNFPKIQGDIVFENVSFSYEDSNINVLDDVSFTIKEGSKVAIIGKTGSGKSTITYLLARLLDPSNGVVSINGIDFKEINRYHIRNNIRVNVQEPYLFSKNILENLKIVNEEIAEEEVRKYTKMAHIHNDIENFPEGYETLVGERGTTLSGGQKQRLAIARLLIDQKMYIVFDDSLSAVDNETDRSIREGLETIKGITTIIITHRLTSILDVDQVIVLDEGKLIEQGTVEELIALNGYFKRLYDVQVGDENE